MLKFVISFTLVLLLDTASKLWAEANLLLHVPQEISGNVFRFTLGYNTGVAFGMMTNAGIWPLIITGAVIIGLSIWFMVLLLHGDWPNHAAWPVGMVLGGAVGNFADRLIDQRVTDFLDVGVGDLRWPTFNIADSFIVVGLILLVIITHFDTPHPTPVEVNDEDSTDALS